MAPRLSDRLMRLLKFHLLYFIDTRPLTERAYGFGWENFEQYVDRSMMGREYRENSIDHVKRGLRELQREGELTTNERGLWIKVLKRRDVRELQDA